MLSRFSLLRNPLFRYGLVALVVYGILYYIYEPITLGLDMEDITVLAIPSVLGLFLFQYFLSSTILHRPFLAHALVGIGWGLTFPLLYHWSYTKPFYFYEFSKDYLFGMILFIGLVLLQYAVSIPQKWPRTIAAIFSFFDWVLAFIPLVQIAYYVKTWHCLSPATLMALYQTDPAEAFGFLKSSAGYVGLIGLAIGLIILYAIFFWSNITMPRLVNRGTTRPLRLVIVGVVSVAFVIYAPFFLFWETNIVKNWTDVAQYMKQMQQYDTIHQNIFADVHLTETDTSAKKTPGTIILVIGESASRNYMKAYTPSFTYDDTPWQDTLSKNPDFIFFNHAYSSYVQTVPTLERALTERNQYDDKPFLESANILDIAKKAGYHTTWFSNQGVYGEYDTAISLIAKTADRAQWAHEAYMFSDKYDGVLLPLLKTVDPNQNNFIVIHIMGSHIYYNDRYPHEFSKWKVGEVPTGKEAYANSQLYTDWLLKNIYEYASKNLHLQAMVYFSDHGESLQLSHNPDVFDFDMTRIPFWIYLSPQYRAAYPQTVAALTGHEHQYFTNDLLYDTLSGIMHAQSNRYDVTRDFSNVAYRFNRNNLTTLLGQQPLTNDPNP